MIGLPQHLFSCNSKQKNMKKSSKNALTLDVVFDNIIFAPHVRRLQQQNKI